MSSQTKHVWILSTNRIKEYFLLSQIIFKITLMHALFFTDGMVRLKLVYFIQSLVYVDFSTSTWRERYRTRSRGSDAYLSGVRRLLILGGWRRPSFQRCWGDRRSSHVPPPPVSHSLKTAPGDTFRGDFQHSAPVPAVRWERTGDGIGFLSLHSDSLSGCTVEPLSLIRPVLVCL